MGIVGDNKETLFFTNVLTVSQSSGQAVVD